MCEKPQQSLQYTVHVPWLGNTYTCVLSKLVAGGEGVGRGNKNYRTQESKITEEDFNSGIYVFYIQC